MGRIPEKKTGQKVRRTLTGAMTAVLVAGTVLGGTASMAVPAFANTEISYGTGTDQIDNVEGQVTTYKVFQIFQANKNADGTMSNFAWPSDAVRNAVIGVIQKYDAKYTSFNAQDAADFISAAYKNASGELTTDQNTILENKELLNAIAAAVDDVSGFISVSGGESKEYAEGYWMAVTDGTSVGVDEDGTSPIFFIASGGPVKLMEKTSLPTVDKRVMNDAVGAVWEYGAEAQRGQSVAHKITGTVAKNLKTYDLYYYEFEDVMSKGIDYDMGTYKVMLDGVDVTSYFTEKLTHNENGADTLSVSCDNILNIRETTPKEGSVFELTYTVQLNDKCIVGAEGNPNDVRIIYSSNPNTREKSSTHVIRDYLYTFGVHVDKRDRDTNVSLAGAKFTIQATDPDDKESKGLYVQADGTLGTEEHEFVTDENGEFAVNGLDAGTYTLHETQCPEEYQVINKDTKFTITASYNGDGTLSELNNTVSGNKDAAAGVDTTNDNKVNGDAGSAADAEAGMAYVTVGNIEKVKMPLSGENGIGLIVTAGGLVTGISLAALLASRKKKKTDTAS